MENCPRTGPAHLFHKSLILATGRKSLRCSINWKRGPPQAGSAAALERWLLDWSELNAALDEESSRRTIAMTCHTDNVDAEKAYLHFVENVEPQLKPRQFALEKIYAAHPLREKLPRTRFQVFDRDVKNHVELFRQENVPLETEEAKLSQQYQKLSGCSPSISRRGKDARADGPLSGGTGPRPAAGGVGTRGQAAPAGGRQVRRHF